MTDFASREHAARLRTAADTLRIDAAAAEVIAEFTRRGVEARLLKGRATADWLYEDAPRYYVDADILVRPDQIRLAGETLLELGFAPELDHGALPVWWRSPDWAWHRPQDGVSVDLHSGIPGVGINPAEAWIILTAGEPEAVLVGGRPMPTLSVPARALHLALHVTHHGRLAGRHLDDLERGIAQCALEVWREAAALAGRLGALDSFSQGLRAVESGAKLAEELSLPEVSSLDVELAGNAPPAGALTLNQLISARGTSARMAIIFRKLFPPPAYMRVWAPEAASGLRGLLLAYIRRPLWVLRTAPKAGLAYRRARRNVRSRKPGELR